MRRSCARIDTGRDLFLGSVCLRSIDVGKMKNLPNEEAEDHNGDGANNPEGAAIPIIENEN
jgi:hypothetical protein